MANYYNWTIYSGTILQSNGTGITWVEPWGAYVPSVPIGPVKQQKIKCGNEEGYECCSCQEFSPMAELNFPENQDEKHSFKCFVCRKG